MKKCKFTILLGVLLLLILCQCSKSKEPAPFFDGLYLNYEEVSGKSQKEKTEDILWTRQIRYRFQQKEDGTFKIFQQVHTERGQGLKKEIEPVAYPEAWEDLTVDAQGTVLQGGDGINFVDGYPSYLWLPRKHREEGAAAIPIIQEVKDKTEWEGWQVWPVVFGESSIKANYYESEMGILVGMEAFNGKIKMMLKETNLKGLRAALSEKTNK